MKGSQTTEVIRPDVRLQEELVLTDQLQRPGLAQVGLVLRAEVLVVVQAPVNTEIKLGHFGSLAAWQLGWENLKPIK